MNHHGLNFRTFCQEPGRARVLSRTAARLSHSEGLLRLPVESADAREHYEALPARPGEAFPVLQLLDQTVTVPIRNDSHRDPSPH